MAITASTIVSEVYPLLGRPSFGDLPYEDVLAAVRDSVRGRMIDLKLSARNHSTQVGAWVTPSAREMASSGFVGGLTQFIPVKAEWRYTSEASLDPAPYPRKAQIVAFETLGDLTEKSVNDESYVAFYDNWENIAFSQNTTELALRQYRIFYEDTSDVVATSAATVELPPLFTTLCSYESAILCIPKIQNDAFDAGKYLPHLTAQLGIWESRFNKWRTTQFGNKKAKKQGFRPRILW